MRVPYHKQINRYFCAPACLQMAFDFFGIQLSQETLAEKLKTKATTGTTCTAVTRVVKKYGFKYFDKFPSSLSDIKKALASRHIVIVDYIEPSENVGHFAVVTGYTRHKLCLNDPWNGKGFTIHEDDFYKRWHNEKGTKHRWMLVIVSKN